MEGRKRQWTTLSPSPVWPLEVPGRSVSTCLLLTKRIEDGPEGKIGDSLKGKVWNFHLQYFYN